MHFQKKLDSALCGRKDFRIPAEDILDVIDINASRQNSMLISFSKIIDKAQDLTGFIKAYGKSGEEITSTSIRGNILTLFSDSNFEEMDSIEISGSIRSADGFKLGCTSSTSLSD